MGHEDAFGTTALAWSPQLLFHDEGCLILKPPDDPGDGPHNQTEQAERHADGVASLLARVPAIMPATPKSTQWVPSDTKADDPHALY